MEQALLLDDATLVTEYTDPVRYDLEYGATAVDGPFYRSLLDEPGSVLDLATGTGRVALVMAEAGHTVVGIDESETMIDRARAKAEAIDDPSVEFAIDDARTVNLRRKFDLVLLAGNALQAFLTDADRTAVLNTVWRHLKPEGKAAIAVRFPHISEFAVDDVAPWFTYLDHSGRDVYVSGTQQYHPVAQVMEHVTHRVFADGTIAEAPTHVALRYSFPQELESALKAARLSVVARYGDFDKAPLAGTSAHMIFVCERASR